jgi:hypothetical protein
MGGVITTGGPATRTEPTQARLDRPVLVGNLVSGAALCLLPLAFGSWPLSLIGAVYVAAASVFLAAVYAREALTRGQEALAWATPWLVAVSLWTLLIAGFGSLSSVSGWFFSLIFGLCIGTACYLAWQILALAVRQLVGWLSGTAPSGP